jgi:hypothetical protein
LQCGGRAANRFAVKADGGTGRAGLYGDGVHQRGVDACGASGDAGTKDKKGNGDTHSFGAWGG